jgi:uncharacterized protein (TIGR01777 family)
MKTNRIILAGGSGYLGHLLTVSLVRQGCEVVILTRSPQTERLAARDVLWDAQSAGPWVKELDGAAAVINLTGRSVNCRYTETNRRLILESRVLSIQVLGDAIEKCAQPPPVWLNASTATIYKQFFDRDMDETGEIASDRDAKDEFSVEVAQAWEEALNQARTPATRKIALRLSMVFGPREGTVFRVLRRLARLGLGGSMGGGRQFVSWIHEEDFCRAAQWLLTHDNLTGPFNLAAPNPVTNREMMKTLRGVVGAPFGLPAARWMLEVGAFFLRTETELMIKSRRVVPGRLISSGFQFNFPELGAAMADIQNRISQGAGH